MITINVIAVEVSEDDIENYSYVIAVKENDGVNHFYNIEYMVGATWDSFIDYHKAHEDNFPFFLYNGYVMYKNYYLDLDGNRVLSSDTLMPAAIKVYTLSDSLIILEDNTIRFNGYAEGEKTFARAIDELYGFGVFNNSLITYQNYIIYYDSGMRSVEGGTIIVSGHRYLISPTSCSDGNHTFQFYYQINPTCQTEGSVIYKCAGCHIEDVRTIPVDVENGHAWEQYILVYPTCVNNGQGKKQCLYCGKEGNSVILSAYGHNYSKATCTEPSKCLNGCGSIKQEALGHSVVSSVCEGSYCERCFEYFVEPEGHIINYKNQCIREGCDYVDGEVADRPVLDWIVGAGNTVDGFFENTGENIGNWWNDTVVPGFNNFGQGVTETTNNIIEYIIPGADGTGLFGNMFDNSNNKDDKPGFDDVWRILIIVLCAIPIIALIYFVIVAIIKIKGKINTMPKEKKRKRRKRKKV